MHKFIVLIAVSSANITLPVISTREKALKRLIRAHFTTANHQVESSSLKKLGGQKGRRDPNQLLGRDT